MYLTALPVKVDCSTYLLVRKGDLKKSQQRDLSESISWHITGRLEYG